MPLHVMSYHAVSHHSHYIYIYLKRIDVASVQCIVGCLSGDVVALQRILVKTCHSEWNMIQHLHAFASKFCSVSPPARHVATERVPFCRHCIRTFLLTSWNASKREAGHPCAQKLLHIFTQSFRVPGGCSFCLFDLIYDVPLAPAPGLPLRLKLFTAERT